MNKVSIFTKNVKIPDNLKIIVKSTTQIRVESKNGRMARCKLRKLAIASEANIILDYHIKLVKAKQLCCVAIGTFAIGRYCSQKEAISPDTKKFMLMLPSKVI